MILSKAQNLVFTNYSIQNFQPFTVEEYLVLGVHSDSGFTFVNHTNYVIPKGYVNLACTTKLLLNSIDRSKLEYTYNVVSPV